MTAEDHFDDFYRSEGVRYFEDMTHRGFMRYAYLHGWAASRAKELDSSIGGMTASELKAVSNYFALVGGMA